ncbi:MAG TPA: SDR family oxidoreductase [Thermoanaerobaculia bacterium]
MIENQTAIVTGASRGLGRHVALRLAQERVRVAVAARTFDEVTRVAEEIRAAGGEALPLVIDVASWSSVEQGVATVRQQFGKIDILVNNAGVGWYKPFTEHTIEELDRTIDVNLKGTLYMTKAVLPDMQAAHYGQIVNVASDLGRRVIPGMAAYVASKFGVLGFAGSILREVKGSGVKVTTLTPGIIDTFFGGAVEGTKEETWSLRPEFVAGMIVDMLKLPKHWVVDELAIHAMGQEF